MKNHRYRNTKLVCKTCADQGFSAQNLERVICSACSCTLGHLKFDPRQLRNAKDRGILSGLVCLPCKDLRPCGGCSKKCHKSEWSSTAKDNHNRNRYPSASILLCRQCRKEGRTPQDVSLYTCVHCGSDQGCGKFATQDLQQWKQDKRALMCKACVEIRRSREHELKIRLQHSKLVCNCFCAVHKDKCPLSSWGFHQRLWPGRDPWNPEKDCISLFDCAFLNSLRPTPKWWAKAWGRR